MGETQAPTEWIPTSAPGVKTRGILTMWSTQQALIGAQCEYANAPVGSVSDPVLSPYLRSGYHCAIGDSNPGFGRGEHCGKCYRITSLNDDGTHGTPGNKGSAVVTVSDGGAGGPAHFDCILEGFEAITGATTGVFDVDFEEVLCEDVTANPVIINWADQNAWYCPQGTGSSMTFDLTQRSPSGEEATITCTCEGSWPWLTGRRCSCPTNFGSA